MKMIVRLLLVASLLAACVSSAKPAATFNVTGSPSTNTSSSNSTATVTTTPNVTSTGTGFVLTNSTSTSSVPGRLPKKYKPLSVCFYIDAINTFVIRGRGWDATKFGESGEGLKENLGFCHNIKKYVFTLQRNSTSPYEWLVEAEVERGLDKCFYKNKVLKNAGAPNVGQCKKIR